MLIPAGPQVLCLFSYPSPGLVTLILVTCAFPFKDLNTWFPSPKPLKGNVLTPAIHSFKSV